jgi:hypothetical protein
MNQKALTQAKQLLKETKEELIDEGVISDDGYYHSILTQIQVLLDEVNNKQEE